jgi:hypothetical protein
MKTPLHGNCSSLTRVSSKADLLRRAILISFAAKLPRLCDFFLYGNSVIDSIIHYDQESPVERRCHVQEYAGTSAPKGSQPALPKALKNKDR